MGLTIISETLNSRLRGIPVIDLNVNKNFPCLVCARPLEVKQSKKAKPCLVCDPCGIQVFIRGRGGIDAFNKLVERGYREGVFTRVEKMEPRYRLQCPECGDRFWIEPSLIKTSFFDGSFQGFQCPSKGCGTTVSWEKK
jgi:DNA-directed RNA polymerase subunit RPC12/RpoP